MLLYVHTREVGDEVHCSGHAEYVAYLSGNMSVKVTHKVMVCFTITYQCSESHKRYRTHAMASQCVQGDAHGQDRRGAGKGQVDDEEDAPKKSKRFATAAS
jgi:hypothetical protein